MQAKKYIWIPREVDPITGGQRYPTKALKSISAKSFRPMGPI